MFDRFKKNDVTIFDPIIVRVLEELQQQDPNSEEFKAAMDHLERLTDMKEGDQPSRVSRDTLAIVAGNLLGILAIVAYEQKHVITSKGLSFVMKAKS